MRRRLSECSISEKILYSLFIILLGTGYLFAMVLIYITVSPLDGKPGLSVEDIAIKYHGNRTGTKLETALTGSMSAYRSPEEYMKIVAWIDGGAGKAGYEKDVRPIIEARCVRCHGPSGMGVSDLTSYELVSKFVEIDTGVSFGALVSVSHIHLFGVSMIFFLLGGIFIRSEMPLWLKNTIIAVPFVAIVLDIGSWWFTRYLPIFSYTVLAGGALMGLSFAVQAFVSLYQMWLGRRGGP